MTTLVFDSIQFRAQFPAFADTVAFPDSLLSTNWTIATYYVDDNGSYGWMQGEVRQYAINLMCAHITQLGVQIGQGQTPYIMQNSTIDKITVGLTPPPLKNQWQWWVQTTPYGMQLHALLQAQYVGGDYIGGSPVLAGFPRPGVCWPW